MRHTEAHHSIPFAHLDDPYPTRTERRIGLIERQDPIVCSEGAARTEGPLEPEALARFERDGFVAIEGFFEEDEIAAFREDLHRYGYDAALKAREQVITEPESNELRSIFGIHALSERFHRLTRDPRLLAIARQILASDVYVHQSRINYKPGLRGRGFNWHSDFETWHSEDGMPRMRCFSVSITLTENNEFNGPLMLVPGSHRWFIPCVGRTPDANWKTSLKSQTIGVPDAEIIRRLVDLGGLEAPKGPAGTMILFDCNTLHASANNLSPYPRSNLFFVYNSVENRLREPYAAPRPRPEYLGARTHAPKLEPMS